jgi:transcriptional regulator with XRE-family HTH domain
MARDRPLTATLPRVLGGTVISPATDRAAESFRGLLLRHRGRTGLTQRELAARIAASRRAVQEWEAGLNHPNSERLQTLIRVFLDTGGLTVGLEEMEAHELWAAAMHTCEAYLAAVEAQDASLAGAHLSEAVLAEAFSFPISVALSDDGQWLVAGTGAGEVCLWRVADRTALLRTERSGFGRRPAGGCWPRSRRTLGRSGA